MLLGLAGKSKAGKDTLASVLVKDYGFNRVAFADEVKEVCSEVFNVPKKYFYDEELKDKKGNFIVCPNSSSVSNLFSYFRSKGYRISKDKKELMREKLIGSSFLTPRELLQYVGTDIARDILDKDIWLKITLQKVSEMEGSTVITDCRFKNELDSIKNMGGKCGLVVRPGVINEIAGEHKSENVPDIEYDYIFINDGSITDFSHQISLWYQMRFSLDRVSDNPYMRE